MFLRAATAAGDLAFYDSIFAIKNLAGTTALIGSVVENFVGEGTGGWGNAITADDGADTLIATFTPDVSAATVVEGFIEYTTMKITV